MTLQYTLLHWRGDQKGADSYTEEMRKADAFRARGGVAAPPSTSGLARAALRFHTHDYHFNWAYKLTWLLHNICADASLLVSPTPASKAFPSLFPSSLLCYILWGPFFMSSLIQYCFNEISWTNATSVSNPLKAGTTAIKQIH